jgi:hypothetical protein
MTDAKHDLDMAEARALDIAADVLRGRVPDSPALMITLQTLTGSAAKIRNGGLVRAPGPRFIGSSPARQPRGLPGHCDRCAALGHIKAHPHLGCADIGCNAAH